MSKQAIERASLVETHFVDQLLEHQRLVRKQVHAPLPVVETNRPGNDLVHRARILSSNQAVLAHQVPTLADRQGVPVILVAALLVHGIKAMMTAARDAGP